MTYQCDSHTRLNSNENIMSTIPVNHDQVITQNVNKDLFILKCTCHLKALSYYLQMVELSVNICKLYKIHTITGHTIQRYMITGHMI